MHSTFVIAALGVLFLPSFHAASICKTGQTWILDPHDCTKFHMCRNGQEIEMQCPEGMVAYPKTRSCVLQGSKFDTCTGIIQFKKPQCLAGREEKFEHPESCSKYYDCAGSESTTDISIKECEYPFLFNIHSQRCEHFSMVECGKRYEPKNQCEYESGQCRSSHCVPCHMRHPSCRGMKNGFNPWLGRERSPFFVICENERVVYQGRCPNTSDSFQMFNEELKVCTSFEEFDD